MYAHRYHTSRRRASGSPTPRGLLALDEVDGDAASVEPRGRPDPQVRNHPSTILSPSPSAPRAKIDVHGEDRERPAAAGRPAARERIINRELSILDWNAACSSWRRITPSRCSSASTSARSCPTTSTSSSWCGSAGLLDQARAGWAVRSPDGPTPQEALAEIRERVIELTRKQSKLWGDELSPALAARGDPVGRVDDLSKKEVEDLERRFTRDVFPVLTPLAVGPGQPFPYISRALAEPRRASCATPRPTRSGGPGQGAGDAAALPGGR